MSDQELPAPCGEAGARSLALADGLLDQFAAAELAADIHEIRLMLSLLDFSKS